MINRKRWAMIGLIFAPALCFIGAAITQPAAVTRPTSTPQPAPARTGALEPWTHDPTMIKQGDTYYLFYTGNGINTLQSKDLIHWSRGASVFRQLPAWIAQEVPAARGLWAPDISFFSRKYHLYYAASSFGKNRSCIGVATNATLDPASKDFKWEDHGKVLESQTTDNFNAIDPNIFVDEKGVPWLDFGSFWTGIKLRKLLPDTGMPDPADPKRYDLATRTGRTKAIEAPFIVARQKFFYLFVSFDACCNGLRSTYRVMVGRSETLTGPYADKAGTPMLQGGGTELVAGDGKRIIAPGHCAVIQDGDNWLMIYHFLDANDRGRAKLQVRAMKWDEKGWPVMGEVINAAK